STRKVQQSPYYNDVDTGQPREIDVVALYPGDASPLVVSVEVECKAKAEPFIVLLPNEFDRDDQMRFRCLSRHARTVMPTHRDTVAVDLNGTMLFDPVVPVGHSILTKTGGRHYGQTSRRGERPDKGWEAAMTAVKAAHWFATRLDDTDH